MKANEKLLNRIREALMDVDHLQEKTMFGGICFMVNDKMCVCIRDDRMMCRVGPENYEACLEKNGCEPMIHGKKQMKGYVFVYEEGYKDRRDFETWIRLALNYNQQLI